MKKYYQKWWFWVTVVVLLVLGIMGGIDEHLNIISTTNKEVLNEKKVTFLKGSKGKEFFKILCEVADLDYKDAQSIGDSVLYETVDVNYSIEVETNKNNEINWLRMMAFQDNDYENFFLAVSRLEYENSNKTEAFNWIHDNLGKEAITKIGDANLKLSISTSNKPILEIYTDGNEQYQKEQLDKII